jgi:hypothetical protein
MHWYIYSLKLGKYGNSVYLQGPVSVGREVTTPVNLVSEETIADSLVSSTVFS